MTEWRETTLGEVCELKRGYDLPAARRQEGDVPIVSSSGITGYHAEAKVRAPGVVTGRYGTLGEVFFIEEDFWPLNTALYVRDFRGNEPRFVAALLQSLELGVNDGAAAVPGVNRNQLHRLPVLCPNPETQHRIGRVLGALDDLIENNRRRIEVLEQMAQAIWRCSPCPTSTPSPSGWWSGSGSTPSSPPGCRATRHRHGNGRSRLWAILSQSHPYARMNACSEGSSCEGCGRRWASSPPASMPLW